MIYVHNFRTIKYCSEDIEIVNCTSRSTDWSRGLSPFFVGPIKLYGNYVAENCENAWQFSKLYSKHSDQNGDPKPEYFEWAEKGWKSKYAYRYPMGRDIKPLCSYWDGEKLDYVNARKRIYIPLYADAVSKTKAFQQLKDLYQEKGKIALVDFDSHGLTPNTFDYWDLWNNPEIKVGHGYVLAMLLEGKLC